MIRVLAFASFVALLAVGCQYHPSPVNGHERCAATGKRCPDGYACASDGTCWKSGQGPGGSGDGGNDAGLDAPKGDAVSTVDLGPGPDGSPGSDDGGTDAVMEVFVPHDAAPAPSGHSLVPGGTTSLSSTYKMVKTTGQSPGGNGVHSSASYKLVGGLIGATQK